MNVYQIQIGPRGAPRLSFEAMAEDSFTASVQHLGLAENGERVDVTPVKIAAAKPRLPDYGSYGMRCSLCGSTSLAQVCGSCCAALEKSGGRL